MRVAKNNSHIALLQFAYCRLSFRFLLIFYRNVFLPHPEGTVEPILLNILQLKQTSPNTISALGLVNYLSLGFLFFKLE